MWLPNTTDGKTFPKFTPAVFLASMYTSMFAVAYYGLLRVGELTSGEHPIKVHDVHVGDNKRKILFILRSSKTHWKDTKPQTVKLTSIPCGHSNTPNVDGSRIYNWKVDTETDMQFCPYYLVKRYISLRRSHKFYDEPFYIFQDRSPGQPRHMRSTL